MYVCMYVCMYVNGIKIDPYNFELYRFKVGAFFETQCTYRPKSTKTKN